MQMHLLILDLFLSRKESNLTTYAIKFELGHNTEILALPFMDRLVSHEAKSMKHPVGIQHTCNNLLT